MDDPIRTQPAIDSTDVVVLVLFVVGSVALAIALWVVSPVLLLGVFGLACLLGAGAIARAS